MVPIASVSRITTLRIPIVHSLDASGIIYEQRFNIVFHCSRSVAVLPTFVSEASEWQICMCVGTLER